MLDVFKEYLNWSNIMGLNNAGDFNMACEEGHATDLINVAEALQEKKIAQIADTIFHRGENGDRIKLVLIAGPMKMETMTMNPYTPSIWLCSTGNFKHYSAEKKSSCRDSTSTSEKRSTKGTS